MSSLEEPTIPAEIDTERGARRLEAMFHLNRAAQLLTGDGAALFYAITSDAERPLVGSLGDELEVRALRQRLRALLEALDAQPSSPL